MDGANAKRLVELLADRDAAKSERRYWYLQGRIDEFCDQNAIGVMELAELHAAWQAGRVA